ncbi:unnamed protein product [Closterium sp. Yama58-4]|nr:unnamed protein product [Closterium sp. Yama58-4]
MKATQAFLLHPASLLATIIAAAEAPQSEGPPLLSCLPVPPHSMGLLSHPISLITTIIAAAKALNLRAVVVTSGDSALEEAVAAVWREEEQEKQKEQGEEEDESQERGTDSIVKSRGTLSVDNRGILLSQRTAQPPTQPAPLKPTTPQPAPPLLPSSPLVPLGIPRLLARGRVLVLRGPVCHEWLFPRCCFVLHHAGSGTTAAALRAGVPQLLCPFILDQHYWAHRLCYLGLLCPFILDQHYWADRLCYLGVAPPPLHPSDLMPLDSTHQTTVATVVSRFAAALGAGMRERARELSREIQTEVRLLDDCQG